MFGSGKNGANAYASVSMETGVGMASPHTLVVMLFDGALLSIAIAQKEMKAGNIAAKSKAISKAIAIVDEGLRASLNKEAGGDIARSLNALYEYIMNRLLQGNLRNNLEFITEAQRLLGELRGAWIQIDPNKSVAANQASDSVGRMAQSKEKLASQRMQSYAA
jgi:flagellar secretion chaperone FliS